MKKLLVYASLATATYYVLRVANLRSVLNAADTDHKENLGEAVRSQGFPWLPVGLFVASRVV